MSSDETGSPARPGRVAGLTALFAIAVLASSAFQAPAQSFGRFAFLDSGGELAIQDLLRRGYRPGVDFGYPYGLLSLLVGRLWYGAFGLTPGAFRALGVACMVASAWGFARYAADRRLGPVGIALILLAIPDLMLVTYIASVQAIEQALLVNALAEQARGRRGTALALLAACFSAKPSLAAVQGLCVALAIVAEGRRDGRRAWARGFAPALVTAAVLAVVLGAVFGVAPLAGTILPRSGMAIYRAGHLGFFRGIGREFWILPNAGVRDYFRHEVGFWLLGTAVLAFGAAAVPWRRARRGPVGDDEMIATCAATHLGFVAVLFGHRLTWFYSLPMLILGLATLANRGRWHRAAVVVLAAMLLVSDRSKAVDVLRHWRSESTSAVTLGLWADPVQRQEWVRAMELTRGRRPALLAMCDGAAVLVPGFAPPVGGFYVPGGPLPAEVRRKAAQLAEASMIVSAFPPDWHGFARWPEIAHALEGCDLVMAGRGLWVYRRVAGNWEDRGGVR